MHQYCNFKKDCANGKDEEECPASCDFETDECKWYNMKKTDRMDWARIQGKTPTNGTGPSADHTKGNLTGI